MARSVSRTRLIDKLRRPFVDLPFQRLTLNSVARSAGVSMWAVRYWFDNVENGFRAVARHLVDKAVARFAYKPRPAAGVHEAIANYAEFLASVMRSDDYVDLLALVLRNSGHHDWLEAALERDVVSPVAARLEDLVLETGQGHGMAVLMKEGAARRFFRRLEAEFAIPRLVRPEEPQDPQASTRVLQDIVREAFEATYLFDWVERHAAAGGMSPHRQAAIGG